MNEVRDSTGRDRRSVEGPRPGSRADAGSLAGNPAHGAVVAVIVVGLYASTFYSYLLFHSLIEIITVAVAFTLFILTWNTRSYIGNAYLRVLGIGYLFSALIDLVHTLSYKGMGIFPGYGANLPTQLWIAARYLQALTLLVAPLFVRRRLDDRAMVAAYAGVVAVLMTTVYSGNFPDCFVEGRGLTAFKVNSEYLISALLVASLYLLYRERQSFDRRVFLLTAASVVCTVVSEMSFTAYASVYGLANLVGHFAKLAAFYLIYRAILVTGLKLPFDLIFRDLKQAEEAVRKAHASLEERVRERTAELRASEERYRSLIRKVQTAIVLYDGEGRILDSNPLAQDLLGLSAEQLLGRSAIAAEWRCLREDGSAAPAAEYPANAVLSTRQPLRGRVMGIARTDPERTVWVLVNAEPEFDAAGNIGLVIVSFVDITERMQAEEALRKSESKFAAMFRLTPEPMALTRLDDGVVLDASRSFADLFGYRIEEIVGHSTLPDDLGLWTDAGNRRQWKELAETDGELVGFEASMRRKDGSTVAVLISGKIVEMDGRRCVIVDIHDITEQKQRAEHLEEIAHHDPLTGLPNRLLLGDRLSQAIAQNQRAGTRTAVCYLDLDGFKEVNDRFGHEAGDRVLVEVANRLLGCVRGGDTVARLGGDEFAVLLSGLGDDEECRLALDRILQAVSAPYRLGDSQQYIVSASIGVTLFPSDQADADTLLRHADHAMYVAKQAGKNRYQMFDTRLEQRIEARHATLRGIAEALQSGQFRLVFQPKVDCRLGRIVGAEALIRWRHPNLGMLSPAEFVPLIEGTELAVRVGEWVLRESLARIAQWRQQGLEVPLSVNAFTHHLLQPGFAQALAAILRQFPDAGADRLCIEIVETAALKEIDAIRRVIEDCRKLGVSFSLDDFGTGYSTLAHLRHLPAREIKIDQSFVGHMLARTEDLVMVEAIIGLSRAFGRSVVAEGAETPAHIRRLLELGCDVMQGYALAKPLTADDIPRWVREFRPDPAWYPASGGKGA